MKKLLLILLCVPLMFSCGENDNKNQSERRSEILRNQEARNINDINNPCDCTDMEYVILKDIIDLADGRVESEIKKNEQDSIVLVNLQTEYNDMSNICSEMYQDLGESKFYQNHADCKYAGLNRNLRIKFSELGFIREEEKNGSLEEKLKMQINKTSKRYKYEETSTSNGKVYLAGELFNGIRYSEDKNGKEKFEQEYVNGIKHGNCKSFHINGKLSWLEIYQEGLLMSSECWDENGEKIICPEIDKRGLVIKKPPTSDNYDFEQELIELEKE